MSGDKPVHAAVCVFVDTETGQRFTGRFTHESQTTAHRAAKARAMRKMALWMSNNPPDPSPEGSKIRDPDNTNAPPAFVGDLEE